jgi:DNA-binding response OmpR family regulator
VQLGVRMIETSFTEKPPNHAAYGVPIETLDVMVIDPSRTMQTILRSMLQPMRPRRIRIYDTAADALRDMLMEPPTLVITDWRMEPMSGYRLIKVMRHHSMAPLCFTPVIVVTGHATRSSVESAFRVGAQAVMVKPLAPASLRLRLEWLSQDDRPYRLTGDTWVVDGVSQVLDTQREKERLPAIIAELRAHEDAMRDAGAEDPESIVDQIMRGEYSDSADSEAMISRRARRLREERPQLSPTLNRLMRQRASSPNDSGVLKDADDTAKAAPVPARTKTRWADLWSR